MNIKLTGALASGITANLIDKGAWGEEIRRDQAHNFHSKTCGYIVYVQELGVDWSHFPSLGYLLKPVSMGVH